MPQSSAKGMILVSVILMELLAGMEFDLFIPSFPELQNQFSLSPFWLEALLSVNLAGYCLSLFLVGGLADRYGPKPIILVGLLIFILGSIFCLWEVSYYFMLFGRFLQGVGVAAPAILSFLIIADLYPIRKQQYLMAMLNGVMNVPVAAAPFIGSYITLYFHWQGNFRILLTMGLITTVFTFFYIPTYQLPMQKEVFSLRGYFSLFQSKSLVRLMFFISMNYVPYWIFVGMSPLLYMKDLGVSLAYFGYYQGALALVFGLGSVVFGLMINRVDPKKVLIISVLIFFVGLITIAWATVINCANPLLITVAFFPFIIGQIIPTAILYPLCLNFIPKARGRVSSIIQGTRFIFVALVLQLAGYHYKGSFQNIGIILTISIFILLIALVVVLKNREIMEFPMEG